MGDQTIDFANRFHSLDGDAIRDRKRNFNKLLRDPSFSSNKQLIHNALDNLEPKTYLESLFKVDALIYFKHTAQLFHIIKGGNEVFISKILKQHWFFEEVFQNMDAYSLVNEFLPCLSLAMRLKVMKKLSMLLKQEKVDEIFSCLHKRYGLWIAIKILHCCSKATIQSLLKKEEIKLRVNQVQHLYNRNDGVFEDYLDYYRKTFDKTYNESKITEKMAKKNPVLLLKLINEKKIDTSRLGRRTSKNVFGLIKDDVKNDVELFYKYEPLLNEHVFVRKLGNDFQNIYVKIFPKRIEDIDSNSECQKLVKNYPKKKRWALFSQTFRTKIPEKNISEVFSRLGKQILTFYPTKDVIINWAEHNYMKSNNENFLKYLQPSKSIPLLKEKIKVTSDAMKRGNLVKLLLQTCRKNDDLKALEEVLEYFCVRHRNEEVYFRRKFLSDIERKFRQNLNKLNATHWKYINEQFKILKLKKELQFWSMAPLMSRHLEYLFENGEDYQDSLMDYLNNCIDEHSSIFHDLNNPTTERKILIEMLRNFPDAIKRVQRGQENYYYTLFNSIIEFCNKYPDHFIDVGEYDYMKIFLNRELQNCTEQSYTVFDLFVNVLNLKSKFPHMTLCAFDSNAIEMIVRCCQKGGYNYFSSYFRNSLMKKNRNDFETQLMLTYFNVISKDNPDVKIFNFFIKHEPNFISKYFSEICTKHLKLNGKVIKLLSHLDFDNQLKTIYTPQLESDNLSRHLKVVGVLRDLLPTEEFAVLINKFIPTQAKLDLEDEDVSKLYYLKCKIAKELHKVEEPLKILPIVLKFCVGDYFQSALPSLQGVFYKSPEKELYSHLEKLSGEAVSIRKHVLFMSCELANQEYVMKILTTTEEINVSSQKHLFTTTLKYFRKNPSSELQNMLIKYMSTIDKNDTETLEYLAKTILPKKYRAVYIENCWGFYESLQREGVKVNEYFDNLLKSVTDHIEILTSVAPSFVENIINKYYFNTDKNSIMGYFIVKYLNHGGYKEQKLLAALIQKLTVVKKKDLQSFINNLRDCPNKEIEFMMAFSKHWGQFFSTANAFKEHIMVEILLLNSAKSSVINLAENIISYFDKIISEFSSYALPLLIEIIIDFVTSMKPEEILELSNELLNIKTSAYLCILVIQVISPIINKDVKDIIFYNNIMEKIRNVQDPVVTIYHKNFLTMHNLD